MALNEKDLVHIKDIVEFAVDQSETRIETRFDKIEEHLKKIDGNIDDLIETNQAFIDKFGNHEVRIRKLETKAGVKPI
ncbi:MAG: hypothetical protein Q7S80_02945 [bacterium]|nr:hypothetical protein [bacterium]